MKHVCLLFLFCGIAFFAAATPAPNFTVTTSDGVVHKLYQDYINKHKIMVIEAFFTTCPPCNTHAPYMQALYQSMQTAHPGLVEFMLLSTLSTDYNTKVATYKTTKGLTMPAAGSDGGSQTALQPYTNGSFGDFLGTPTFIVIAGGTGEVYFDIRGNSATETMTLLDQKITELLPQECFLKTYSDNLIDSVQIKAHAANFDTTFWAGARYTLGTVDKLANVPYTVTARKKDNPLKGLSTYDLVLISKHILNIQPFTVNWQFIAADVNCSGTITTTDIVEARKVILGIRDTLPCGSWRFFREPNDSSLSNGKCNNFRGVQMGNVSGPQLTGQSEEDREPFRLIGADQWLEPNQNYSVQLAAGSAQTLEGLQLAFQYNPSALQINKIESPVFPDFNEQSYHVGDTGRMTISTIAAEGLEVPESAALLTIRFHVLRPARLSSVLTLSPGALVPEIYITGQLPLQPALEWQEQDVSAKPIRIFPNPAQHTFSVSFESAVSSPTLLQILDCRGARVFENSFPVEKGQNTLSVQAPTLKPGMFYIKLDGKPAGILILTDK